MQHLSSRLAETGNKEHLAPLERAGQSNYEESLWKAEAKSRNMRVRNDWLWEEHGGQRASRKIWI